MYTQTSTRGTNLVFLRSRRRHARASERDESRREEELAARGDGGAIDKKIWRGGSRGRVREREKSVAHKDSSPSIDVTKVNLKLTTLFIMQKIQLWLSNISLHANSNLSK